MSNRQVAAVFTLATAVLAAPVAPQETKPSGSVRQQVVILGASVSAGFADPTSKGPDGEVNRTYKLDRAFKKAWPRAVARIYNFSDLLMFMQPEERGKKQIEAARKLQPDLLVAIDFLVWFGYGSKQGKVADDDIDAVRLQQLDKGLALLEGFQCPIVLGDYPDMHGASTNMLPPSMIPNVATLGALNKRLHQWAKTRKTVHVFPLASFVKAAVTLEQVYPWGDQQQVALPKNFLLQSDRLHATRLGMLVVVLRIAEALPSILPRSHPLLRPRVTFKGLVEAAGIEDDVPTPRSIKK